MAFNNRFFTPKSFAQLVTAMAAISLGAIACQPASDNPAKIPDTVKTPQMKPSRLSAVRVASETINEISRIERSLRPLFGITGPQSSNPYADCQTSKRISGTEWETRWRCGMESTTSGKTEIEGIETTDFDRNTRVLTTTGKFEIRIFEDVEPRAKAHTLQIRRTTTLTLVAASTLEDFKARVRIKSQVMKKNIRPGQLGSDWTATTTGLLNGKNGQLSFQPGLATTFKGSLYGRGGERLTAWASGEYQMKADSEIALKGMTTAGTCTRPIGTWTMRAKAAGEEFETGLAATDSGVVESSGSQLQSPSLGCFEP
jgi:hypothetical protein